MMFLEVDFILLLKILGGFLALIIIVYFFARLLFGTELIKSSIANCCGATEADQFYYLPGYGMTINATATIVIERVKGAEENPNYTFQKLTLDTQTHIEPDTTYLIGLTYIGNWFSNDEVKITTSENSLLQNITAISEDRISQIIAQVVKAPEDVLEKMRTTALVAPKDQKEVITETYEVSNTFKINADEAAKKTIELKWKIPLQQREKYNNELNLTLVFKNDNTRVATVPTTPFYGIYTRPMSNQTWRLQQPEKGISTSFICFAPDTSRLIKVPVRSSFFIKKQQLPKFSNGILVENYIVKPSEMEGLAAIPINILKAIVSIPAQLFQFKIIRNNLETNYEKSVQNLLDAQQQTKELQQAIIDKNTAQFDRVQQQISELRNITKQPIVATNPNIPQLGKLPAKPTTGVRNIRNELNERDFNLTIRPNSTFPDPQIPFSWLKILRNYTWNDYGNWTSPNCVPVAAAHMITCWSANTSQIRVPNQQEIDLAFDQTRFDNSGNGELQRGCDMQTFLSYWQDKGIGNDRLYTYIQIQEGNIDDLKLSVYYFGGCLIGLLLPKSVKDNAKNITEWKIPQSMKDKPPSGDWAINSWGGHAVPVIGVYSDYLEVISWNKIIQMSYDFYKVYNDESYVLLSKSNWIKPDDKTPVGEQYTSKILADKISSLGKYA